MPSDYYKNTATSYDQRWETYTNRTLQKMMQYLPDAMDGKVVLDYGCGTGELVRRVLVHHPQVAQVVGYDPSEEMLQQARYKVQQLPEAAQPKFQLTSKDQYDTPFDLIVSASVLHYLADPLATLKNFRDLLQPGGTLVLLDYSKASVWPRYFEWAIRLIDQAHQQAYYPAQIREIVKQAGFHIQQEDTFKIDFWWEGYIVRAGC